MSRKNEDEKLKKILACIGKNPKKSSCQISRLTRIPRNVVKRKIKQYDLNNNGILTQEEKYTGRRKADLFCMTFKGLIYALDIKAIKPKDAADIRLKSTIDTPFRANPMIIRKPYEKGSYYAQIMSELHLDCLIDHDSDRADEDKDRFEKSVGSLIEGRFSERIYSELVKKVNLNYYDEDHAIVVFQTEYQKCLAEFWERIWGEGDPDLFREMCICATRWKNPSKKELDKALEMYSEWLHEKNQSS